MFRRERFVLISIFSPLLVSWELSGVCASKRTRILPGELMNCEELSSLISRNNAVFRGIQESKNETVYKVPRKIGFYVQNKSNLTLNVVFCRPLG